MTSEQAVMLVGKWLNKKAKRESDVEEVLKHSTYLQQVGSNLPQRSQVTCWKVHAGSITVVDDNAATHLARNAFGGADEELFRGSLHSELPFQGMFGKPFVIHGV